MRWFWLFIAILGVLTGVLYTKRVRSERAEAEALRLAAESEPQIQRSQRRRPREQQPDTDPAQIAQQEPAETEPQAPTDVEGAEPIEQQQAQLSAPTDEAVIIETESSTGESESSSDEPIQTADDDSSSTVKFNPGSLISMINEMESADSNSTQESAEEQGRSVKRASSSASQEQGVANATTTDKSELEQRDEIAATAEASQGETDALQEAAIKSYELRGDGSFRVIDSNLWVQGAGTQAEPYVLGWDVLKAVEKSYAPREDKDVLPDWLNYLDGKTVLIEGNSLVPVVATTTRELLIMQNPWDGCCIGVPPTPYDAVEVVLNHDVDFGNSAVGFGSVQGTFYLDPYVVDGWVMGLYIIEDAQYRSDEGVVFPEF